jgi:hypothetical protein
MDVQKSFVDIEGVATIQCPQCGIIKNISVNQYRGRQHSLKVRCSCNYAWDLLLDFRRHYRKVTELAGIYTLEAPASGGGRLVVVNISRSGVGFNVTSMHSIIVDQKARLQFALDDKKNTLIDKLVIIRSVKNGYIGCEFADDHRVFDKDLGFYLQP